MKKEYKVFNWNYWWQSTTSECANGVAHSRCVVGISLYPLIILYYIYIYFYVYLTYSSNFTFNLNLTISTNTTTANTSEINTIRSSAPLWTQSYTNNAAYYFNYINPSSIYPDFCWLIPSYLKVNSKTFIILTLFLLASNFVFWSSFRCDNGNGIDTWFISFCLKFINI